MSTNQDIAAIIVTGWAFIATAGWLTSLSKAIHLRHQFRKATTRNSELHDAYQKANQEIQDVRKQKVIIAEAYKAKDAECEILRKDKSALNEELNNICRKYQIVRMASKLEPVSQSTLR